MVSLSSKINKILYKLGALAYPPPEEHPELTKVWIGTVIEQNFLQAINCFEENGWVCAGDVAMILRDPDWVNYLKEAERIYDSSPPTTKGVDYKELWEEEKLYLERLFRNAPFGSYVEAKEEIEKIRSRFQNPIPEPKTLEVITA